MNYKLIYLATPYSKYPKGRCAAYQAACEKAAELMLLGHTIFCPIAHSHSIETDAMNQRMTGEWWLRQDFAVLDRCDELWVYQLPGWEESLGVQAEIKRAKEEHIPIKMLAYTEEAQEQYELFAPGNTT